MPTRTIYVREEDIELWEEAQACAGDSESLSAIVAKALRLFIDTCHRQKEAEKSGYERVERTIGVGVEPARRIRFYGRRLARTGAMKPSGSTTSYHEVFLTRKGHILVYSDMGKKGTTYRIYDTLQEALEAQDDNGKRRYPPELVARAATALGAGVVEDLDI